MPASEFSIEKSEVLRYLGHRGQEIGPELDGLIERSIRQCAESAKPLYFWRVFPLTEDAGGQPELEGTGVVLRGRDIKKHLDGAVACAVMASTLGMQVEREMMRMGRRSPTEEVLINAACTALIESVADVCQREVEAYARAHGLVTSFRYSPGYGDFPLEQQREVLGVLDAGTRLGITLTDSMLMVPKKSVSALLGLYPEDSGVRRGGTSCDRCENRETCSFRKEGYGCEG